jgi:heme A synthase
MSLQRFAVATAVATLLLLLVGATVNPSGSSLACPDWPTCYGSFFPAMKNGVEFEHTHRLAAAAVGLMTCVLAVWIWRARRQERRLVALGFAAVGLVVAQGVLGGITVLLRLPLLVSVGHLAVSMLFFLVLIYLCLRLRPGGAPGLVAAVVPRGLVAAATGGVFVQILLGALVRHTKSGRACNQDWLLCGGELWPSWGPAQLQMAHRIVGVVVALLVTTAAIVALRRAARRPLARAAALAASLVVLLQVALGALLVSSSIGLWQAVAHTGAAALLLGAMSLTFLGLGPLGLRGAAEPGAR